MKNAFDGLISRLHTNEERISVPKVILIETSKNNLKKQKNDRKIEQNVQELSGKCKSCNMHAKGI